MASVERGPIVNASLRDRLVSRPDMIAGKPGNRVAVIVDRSDSSVVHIFGMRLDQRGDTGVVGAVARTSADAKSVLAFHMGVQIPRTDAEIKQQRESRVLKPGVIVDLGEYLD